MHYTGTIWRPPYEACSALIQVTAGCTHHKCKFCTLYEDVPFKFRMSPLSEVEADLKEMSRYYRNAKRVFFTGANPFVLSFDKLKTLAELVKKYYPKVQSMGCFARVTDITPKTTEQLRELREMGYNSLTIGVGAGDLQYPAEELPRQAVFLFRVDKEPVFLLDGTAPGCRGLRYFTVCGHGKFYKYETQYVTERQRD